MEVGSVLVTGANRGIGLEFVRQLVHLPKPPKIIFATYRNLNTATDLKDLRDKTKTCKIVLIQLDTNIPELITSARKAIEDLVGDNGLNLIINNAGALKNQPFSDLTEENLLFHFRNNVIGPVTVIKEMLPLLQKAGTHHGPGLSIQKAAVINISSMGGSIAMTKNQPPEFLSGFGYRVSKTALNMAMRIVAMELKEQGILVVQFCPGWVKTDMGDSVPEHLRKIIESLSFTQTTTEESISSMLKTMVTLKEEHQGDFMDRYGKTMPF